MSQKERIAKLKMHAAKAAAMAKFEKMTPNEIAVQIKCLTVSNFLHSKEWRELKAEAHSKYGFRCMCCGYLPKDRRKSHVDHIKPRKLYPELSLDFENLQILCALCNKRKGNKHMTDYRRRRNQ